MQKGQANLQIGNVTCQNCSPFSMPLFFVSAQANWLFGTGSRVPHNDSNALKNIKR